MTCRNLSVSACFRLKLNFSYPKSFIFLEVETLQASFDSLSWEVPADVAVVSRAQFCPGLLPDMLGCPVVGTIRGHPEVCPGCHKQEIQCLPKILFPSTCAVTALSEEVLPDFHTHPSA